MKNIMESSETLTAYAIIDMCYYEIKNIQERTNKPLAPIAIAVQQACGYDPYKEGAKEIIEISKTIIENKKIIEADYSGDEKLIQDLQTII